MQDARGLIDPGKAWAAMMKNEKPGGHGERSVAVGVLDMALWDALAKAEGVPLWKLLADRYNGGKADGIGLGLRRRRLLLSRRRREAASPAEMRGYLDRGYSTVKMKIGGADLATDLKRIEAALKVLNGRGENLCVDANGRFDLDTAVAYADAIAPLELRWYEEPVDPLDYLLHAALARAVRAADSRPARTCSRCRTRAT